MSSEMSEEELRKWAASNMERLIAASKERGYSYNVGVLTSRSWNAPVSAFQAAYSQCFHPCSWKCVEFWMYGEWRVRLHADFLYRKAPTE